MHTNGYNRYILLSFSEGEFELILNESLNGEPAIKRGVYIDGYFYMFGQDDFKISQIN